MSRRAEAAAAELDARVAQARALLAAIPAVRTPTTPYTSPSPLKPARATPGVSASDAKVLSDRRLRAENDAAVLSPARSAGGGADDEGTGGDDGGAASVRPGGAPASATAAPTGPGVLPLSGLGTATDDQHVSTPREMRVSTLDLAMHQYFDEVRAPHMRTHSQARHTTRARAQDCVLAALARRARSERRPTVGAYVRTSRGLWVRPHSQHCARCGAAQRGPPPLVRPKVG